MNKLNIISASLISAVLLFSLAFLFGWGYGERRERERFQQELVERGIGEWVTITQIQTNQFRYKNK